MKPVYAELRKQEHTNLRYIDDSLLRDTVEKCTLNVEATRALMESLGLRTPHLEKSVLTPTQVIGFLGVDIKFNFNNSHSHRRQDFKNQEILSILVR